VLIAIAAALPRDADALARFVQGKFMARNTGTVLAALASRDDAELQSEVRANAAGPAPDKHAVKALQEQVRQRAATLGIEPEILATRRDLAAVALGDLPPHLKSGWRAQELAAILGRTALPAEAATTALPGTP
jgi:ribonuclease D